MNLLLDSILKTSIILAAALVALALTARPLGVAAALGPVGRHRLRAGGASALARPSGVGDSTPRLAALPVSDGASTAGRNERRRRHWRFRSPWKPSSRRRRQSATPTTPCSCADVVRWAGSIWLAGVAVSLLLLGLGIVRLVRVARAARPRSARAPHRRWPARSRRRWGLRAAGHAAPDRPLRACSSPGASSVPRCSCRQPRRTGATIASASSSATSSRTFNAATGSCSSPPKCCAPSTGSTRSCGSRAAGCGSKASMPATTPC